MDNKIEDKSKSSGRTAREILKCAIDISKKGTVPIYIFAKNIDLAKTIGYKLVEVLDYLNIPFDNSMFNFFGKSQGVMGIDITAITLYDHSYFE